MSCVELSKIYPMGAGSIGRIVMGRRWKHAPFVVSQPHRVPLPDGEVRQIRAMRHLGLPVAEIAELLGRSRETVYKITTGRNRASVPD